MSDYKVPLTTIVDIQPHSNADRLSVATVYGFQVIIGKDQYNVGDLVVYVPIDSILPQSLEDKLFPSDSKIKLTKHRVRQIRIRGLASQGMIISPSEVDLLLEHPVRCLDLETDLSKVLGIVKYEPPFVGASQPSSKLSKLRSPSPHFHRYGGLDNFKWFPDLFKEGEQVVIQEKLHGTNARIGNLPYVPVTLWEKLKHLLGLTPKYEIRYGSNNVDLTNKGYEGYYGKDIYGECFKRNNIATKVEQDCILYGEIIGPGIQKGYDYGLKETQFVVFDICMICTSGAVSWLPPLAVQAYCDTNGLLSVPVLYEGTYSIDIVNKEAKGPSVFCPTEPVREGCVIKSIKEDGTRKFLKMINEDYLDNKDNTDNH